MNPLQLTRLSIYAREPHSSIHGDSNQFRWGSNDPTHAYTRLFVVCLKLLTWREPSLRREGSQWTTVRTAMSETPRSIH